MAINDRAQHYKWRTVSDSRCLLNNRIIPCSNCTTSNQLRNRAVHSNYCVLNGKQASACMPRRKTHAPWFCKHAVGAWKLKLF